MVKFGKSIVIGATLGAAIAYFFKTTKGKEAKEKASDLITDYKDNPKEYNQLAKEKAIAYKDRAVEKFNDYKSKYDEGEWAAEDVLDQVKDKASQVKEVAAQKLNQVKDWDLAEQALDKVQKVKNKTEVDDIVIDYFEDDLS